MENTISLVEKENEWLSPFEVVVNGRRFLCHKDHRKELQSYLDKIPEDEVSVTGLHSIQMPMTSVKKGRGRTIVHDEGAPAKHYHQTLKLTKELLWQVFEDTADRCQQFVEIMAEGVWNMMAKEKAVKGNAKGTEWLNAGADI